jgi:hypothetical protein
MEDSPATKPMTRAAMVIMIPMFFLDITFLGRKFLGDTTNLQTG